MHNTFQKKYYIKFIRESLGSPTSPTNPRSHPTNPWDGICGDGRDMPNPEYVAAHESRLLLNPIHNYPRTRICNTSAIDFNRLLSLMRVHWEIDVYRAYSDVLSPPPPQRAKTHRFCNVESSLRNVFARDSANFGPLRNKLDVVIPLHPNHCGSQMVGGKGRVYWQRLQAPGAL